MKFINLKNLKQQMIQSLKYHFLKSDIPFNNQNPSGINLYKLHKLKHFHKIIINFKCVLNYTINIICDCGLFNNFYE